MPKRGTIGNKGGRPRKPTVIKELQGTLEKSRENESPPVYDVTFALEPPDWLDKIGKEFWMYHAPIFIKARVITEADTSLLNTAAERWSAYRHAAAKYRKEVNQGYDGFKTFQKSHIALTDWLAIMREFGVGPASRAKVKVEKAVEKDEFADLFDSGIPA